jgi:phosphohistidine phosphatase SixA
MKRLFKLRILLAAGLFIAGAAGTVPVSANEALWQQLAEGGKVVLMRHGAVMAGRGNGNSLLRDPSCKKERNLSSEGEAQARAVGKLFQSRNIPIAEVRHSPFCRTADTARIAFGSGTPAAYLSLLEILGPDAAAAQNKELSHVIGGHAGAGNLILVTHEPNIGAVSFELVKTSDFLVLQPKGGSEYEELGVVRGSGSD